MKITYLERVLYLYPEIQGVVYWHSQQDGTPWDEPYDGLFWENLEISKPTKDELDALDEEIVRAEILNRNDILRKQVRDEKAKRDHSILAALDMRNLVATEKMCLSEYLDFLEDQSKDM